MNSGQLENVGADSAESETHSNSSSKPEDQSINRSIISFQSELPIHLQLAMKSFIERYPNWDQYRLIQAALAGFLVQNGVETREITRLYVGNMFDSKALMSQ